MHAALAITVAVLLAGASANAFDYNHQAHWGGACKSWSVWQSPVDLNSASKVKYKWLRRPITFRGSCTFSSSANIRMDSAQHGLLVNSDWLCTMDDPRNKQSYMIEQIRYHTPAEHVIRSQIQRAAVEQHIVLRNIRTGGLLVIAVLFDEGETEQSHTSAALDLIFNYAVPHAGNPSVIDLLPSDSGEFLGYRGSLTTPPCNESVQWIVMKQVVKIDRGLVLQLRALMRDAAGKPYTNARDLQPLDGRRVTMYRAPKAKATELDTQEHNGRKALLAVATCMIFAAIATVLYVKRETAEPNYEGEEDEERTEMVPQPRTYGTV